MSWGVIASPPPRSCPEISIPPRISSVLPQRRFSSNRRNPISSGSLNFARIGVRCNCVGDSGEKNESETVLDAFFLGKALGEALNERIESSVGEFLSVVGRLQAEQQKQLFEFQEEVFEKARRAKEQASREVIETQGPTTVSGVSNSTSSVSEKDPFIGLIKD